MKKISPAIFFLLLVLCSSAQDNKGKLNEDKLLDFHLNEASSIGDLIEMIVTIDEDPEVQALNLLSLGKQLVSRYQHEDADRALALCLELTKDTRLIAAANFEMGVSLSFRDIRKQALGNYSKALDAYTALGDSSGMGKSLDKIADNHNYFGEHEMARPFYDRAILIFTAIKDTSTLTNVLGNIGGMFSDDKQQDSAILYYQKAIRLNKLAGNLSNLSHDLSGLGMALEELKKPEEALKYYHEAYLVAHKGGTEIDKAFANQHLGFYHFRSRRYDSAEHYMNITYEYAQKMNFAQLLINSLEVLHQAAYVQGNHKEAYEIYKEATILNDSLLSLENVSLINSLRAEYEIDQQNAENSALLLEAELREEFIKKQAAQNTLLVLGAFLLLLATIGLVILLVNRRRKNKIILKDRDLIKKQAEKLTEVDRFKSTFFANIAHDYRGPITWIKGFADLIKTEEPKLKNETIDYLDQITSSANRLTRMTEEINQLILLEESQYTLSTEQIDINEFFGTIGKMYQLSEKDTKIQFQFNCTVPSKTMMRADRSALEKIVFNLIGNAFKYNNTGKIVAFEVHSEGDSLILKVTDDGPGISPDKIDKIFDRYYRTEKGTETAFGLGIGLALVKDLVTLHKGEIIARSTPDVETFFQVTLPLNS